MLPVMKHVENGSSPMASQIGVISNVKMVDKLILLLILFKVLNICHLGFIQWREIILPAIMIPTIIKDNWLCDM